MSTVLCLAPSLADRAQLMSGLRGQGFTCLAAGDAATAKVAVRQHHPDVILCDIALADDGAFDVCRWANSYAGIPTLMLTAACDEVEELLAFAAGAEDYLPWTASLRVLAARLRVALRRSGADVDVVSHCRDRLTFDALTLVRSSRRLSVGEVAVHLTRTEFDLLARLMAAPHAVFERTELMGTICGSWDGDDHLLEVHVSRLRTKIAKAGGPAVIDTVRGVGYRLARPGSAAGDTALPTMAAPLPAPARAHTGRARREHGLRRSPATPQGSPVEDDRGILAAG